MTLTYHVWIKSVNLLTPMKQAMLNMSTSLQGDESPQSVRLCVCSGRRSIGRILAGFLHAQTGLHLQQLGLHTQQQTKLSIPIFTKTVEFVQKVASRPSIYLDQWIAFGPAKATSNPVLLVFAGFTSQAFGINCCVSGYDAGSSLSVAC